jgi:putative ABC transport system permease protein
MKVLARKYFPNGDAVGKVICQGDQTHTFTFEIIGVVGHVKQWGLDTDSNNSLRAQVYFPSMQLPDNVISLVPSNTRVVVRSKRNDISLIDLIRDATNRLNKHQALTDFETMHQIIESTAPVRHDAPRSLRRSRSHSLRRGPLRRDCLRRRPADS